jgi:hypothetical protein
MDCSLHPHHSFSLRRLDKVEQQGPVGSKPFSELLTTDNSRKLMLCPPFATLEQEAPRETRITSSPPFLIAVSGAKCLGSILQLLHSDRLDYQTHNRCQAFDPEKSRNRYDPPTGHNT